MLARCEKPSHPDFLDYGGRGIAVCPEWHDLPMFIAWIERNFGPRPVLWYAGKQPTYTLDRINNNGDYEPGNVHWADKEQQASNRRPRRNGVLRVPRSIRHWT
jgi:hypothetical protein